MKQSIAKIFAIFFMISFLLFIFSLGQFICADDIKEKINNKEYRLADDENILIRFSGDLLSGETGINYYTGMYEIVDDEIRLKNIGSTKRAGPEEEMEKEYDYFIFLQGNKKIKILGDKLFIDNKTFIEIKK